ncbi:MAG: MgtC/SapB family protein [Candidatus Moranbacteria bacterium]|nr:MgtC/SapB family protein [Candidatus Moranbacteria bacterium]
MENILDIATGDMVIKLSVALILGVIIGLERVWAKKTAGIRTFALVSMGSALFIIISQTIVNYYSGSGSVDPLRIASQIITGIGFIGTGVIFSKDTIQTGITTATSLWVSAGIGMAVGFGLFKLAIIATLLTLFIFIVLWFVESAIKRSKTYQEDSIGPDIN